MKKKPLWMALIAIALVFTLGQSAFAFKDIAGNPDANSIQELKKRGIIGGYSDDNFKPDGKLTYAEGVYLLVKGFGLNIDMTNFVKEPLASDSFPNLRDDAWYSEAFVIGFHNELNIPQDVKANDTMTREQFAYHLFQAIERTGDYIYALPYTILDDEDEVNPDYMSSIQTLLTTGIIKLNGSAKFFPDKAITRGTAAGWLYGGIQFVETMQQPIEPTPEQPAYDWELKLETEAVTKDVNKVIVSADAPHPGYGLRISSIVFEGDQAIIHVEPVLPDPDRMYPQVITNVKAVAYVDASLKPVLAGSVSGGGTPSHPGNGSSNPSDSVSSPAQ